MLEGKFKCVKSSDCSIMKEGKIYTFVKGVCKCENGIESLPHKSFEEWNNNPADDFKLEPIAEPKYLTNSELWMLAETKQIKDGDMFKAEGDDYRIIFIEDQDGFYNCDCSCAYSTFNVSNKWLQIQSKPKMKRKQIEEVYGIIVED